MIVENQAATLHKAHEISSKIITLLLKETKEFACVDDPAEQIYLTCHTIGNLLAKICMSLEGYGKIYGIPNMQVASIHSWIDKIAKEHIFINEELMKDVVNG